MTVLPITPSLKFNIEQIQTAIKCYFPVTHQLLRKNGLVYLMQCFYLMKFNRL